LIKTSVLKILALIQFKALKRYALSTLVNSLLESEKPIPFEFLINGQFLRTTIDEFLTANAISAETTLNVEYVRALIPPIHISSFEHDDWVSSVDVLSSDVAGSRILSGSFDGLIRVWNNSNTALLATSPSATYNGHTASVKAVKFLTPSKIVSGGNDRTLRIWNYIENETTASIVPTLELYGHGSKINSISVHAHSSQILSASDDHSICLWSTSKSSAPEARSTLLPNASSAANKRRKISKADNKQISQRGPLATLEGHTDIASAAIFKATDRTFGYSSSWDHSVRTWDLTTSKLIDTRTTLHPLSSLVEMQGVNLLAAGSTARHITLIDPRASASKVAAMTLRGHTNAVSSLAQEPGSNYSLVSGSHDGTCRIWDIRSVKSAPSAEGGQVGESVYVINRESAGGQPKKEGVQVFGVVWDKDIGIVSASEDKRVQVNRPMK
jgi:WD40 repeat protein